MSNSPVSPLRRPILSQLPASDILQTSITALDDLYQAAVLKNSRATLVIGNPRSGKTELMKLAYDRLFHEHGRTLPLYYALRRDRLTPEKFARDLLLTLIRQYLAFVQQDGDLVQRYELTEKDFLNLVPAADYSTVKEILDEFESRLAGNDEPSLVRFALGIPQRLAARSRHHIVVLLDEAQWLERLLPGEEFASLFGEILQQPHLVSFILTGKQRALLDQLAAEEGLITMIKLLHVETPEPGSLQDMVAKWCAADGVAFDPETSRLAVQQLDHNIFYLRSLIAAASERKTDLEKGADFERLYVAELLQGRFAHYFSRLLRQIASDVTPGRQGEQAAIDIVYICAEALESRAPIELIKSKLPSRIDSFALLTELHRNELVTLLDGHVLPSEDIVFCDWIRATNKRFAGAGIEEVKLDLLRQKIKTIPQTLALSITRSLHKRIEALLRRFDGQSVAQSLFSHDEFVIRYGHATYEIMLAGLEAEFERRRLPQVYHVAEGTLFIPRENVIAGTWSYLVAFGFEHGVYDQEHEVIWLLAVADSPTAIGGDAVEALDRQLLEIEKTLAISNIEGKPPAQVTKWAISKMGFNLDGTIALAERGFTSSDYLQLELLSRLPEPPPGADEINAEADEIDAEAVPVVETEPEPVAEPEVVITAAQAVEEPARAHDFELEIPINDEKEIVTARVAERLARNAGFSPEAVNQIKTALIEACLSVAAAEHSAEGTIHQRYHLDDEKIVITISNSAAGLDDLSGAIVVDDPQRVWRIDVLCSLVDEVQLMRLHNGWRAELIRFIPKK